MRSSTLGEKLTVYEAQRVLEDEQRERLEACQRELDELLKRHGCQLSTQIGVSQDGRIVANVVLVNAS